MRRRIFEKERCRRGCAVGGGSLRPALVGGGEMAESESRSDERGGARTVSSGFEKRHRLASLHHSLWFVQTSITNSGSSRRSSMNKNVVLAVPITITFLIGDFVVGSKLLPVSWPNPQNSLATATASEFLGHHHPFWVSLSWVFCLGFDWGCGFLF